MQLKKVILCDFQTDIAQARPTLHTPLMQHLTNVISRLLNDPATRAALTSGGDEIGNAESSQEAEILPEQGAPQASPLEGNDDEEEDVNNFQISVDQNDAVEEVYEEDSQNFQLFDEPGTSYDSVPNTPRNISIISEEDNAIVECYETCGDAASSTSTQQQNEYKIAPLKDPDDSSDQNECESSSGLSISDIPAAESAQPKGSVIERNALACSDYQSFGSSEHTNDSGNGMAPSAHSVDRDKLDSVSNEANTGTNQVATSLESVGEGMGSREEASNQTSETSTGLYSNPIHEHNLNTLQSQLVDLREGYNER